MVRCQFLLSVSAFGDPYSSKLLKHTGESECMTFRLSDKLLLSGPRRPKSHKSSERVPDPPPSSPPTEPPIFSRVTFDCGVPNVKTVEIDCDKTSKKRHVNLVSFFTPD